MPQQYFYAQVTGVKVPMFVLMGKIPLFLLQVADVRLCDANEEGGTAGWRLLLH